MQQDGGRQAPEQLQRGETSSASSTERQPLSPRTCSRPSVTKLSSRVGVKAVKRTSGKRKHTHYDDHPQKENNTTDLCSVCCKENDQISPPACKIPTNLPSVTPRTVSVESDEYLTENVKQHWRKITNCNEKKRFKQMKKYCLNFKQESNMSPVNYHSQEEDEISQFSFAVVVMKHKYNVFHQIYPKYKNKTNLDETKHSEETLIGQIDEFLHQNNNINAVKYISIYTYNSPCLQRKDGVECCMFKLLDKACEWEEYGISTEVLYTKSWGLSGPKNFSGLNYSSISDPHSDFYSYCETLKNLFYKFDTKSLKKIQSIFDKMSQENDTKTENHASFEKALKTLADSYCTRDEHLQNLRESLNFFPEQGRIQRIQKQCTELVNNNAMEQIRPKITADFNMFVVKAFEGLLGSSSPLQLRHISEETLELNTDDRLIALINQKISEVKEAKANKQLCKSDKPPIDNLEVQQPPTTPNPTSLEFSVSFSDFNKKKKSCLGQMWLNET